MRQSLILLPAVLCCSLFASSQSADELISKNIQAKGGMDAIKAIKTIRMAGRLDAGGGFTGRVGQENMRPNLLRETFSLQGMTAVQAYDGSTAWRIQPCSCAESVSQVRLEKSSISGAIECSVLE